jgi:hypothetical protein
LDYAYINNETIGKNMTRQEFKDLGEEWTRKNAEYDGYIQELIGNPEREFTPTNISYLEKLQRELFDLETELLKVAKREEVLED